MKVLITGGAGFIGSNLTLFHINKGDKVHVVDNLITGSKENLENLFDNPNFTFTQLDIADQKFDKLDYAYDIIYHLASPASPIQYKKYSLETLKVNSLGTQNLLELLKKNKIGKLVLASTSEVYGDPLVHPQQETYWGNVNPVGVRACYDEAKRFAETLTMEYFRKFKLDVRIARIFNTYGPNMEKNDGRVVSNFIMQSITNQPITIYGDGKQTRSFCYIDDMVTGLYSLATTDNIASQVINLGNPDEYTIQDLASIIKKLTKSNSTLINQPIGPDDPKKRKPDIAKAKKMLGWEPKIKLLDGLNLTIEFFKKRYL